MTRFLFAPIQLQKQLLVLVFLAPLYVFAQSPNIDSLRKVIQGNPKADILCGAYNNLGVEYMKVGDIDSGYYFFEQALTANTSKANITDLCKSLAEIGNILSIKGQNKEALDTLLLAEGLLQSIDIKEQGNTVAKRLYKYIGDVYSRVAIYDKSIDYLQKSIKIAGQSGDTLQIIKNYGSLAIIYAKMRNYAMSLEYNRKGLALVEPLEIPRISGDFYHNIATSFKERDEKGDADSALQYADIAFADYSKAHYLPGMPGIYGLRGEILKGKMKFTEALAEYGKALAVDTMLNLQTGLGYDFQGIGNIFLEMKQYDSAIVYLKKCGALFRDAEMKKELSDTYYSLSEIYSRLHNSDSAIQYLQLCKTATQDYLDNEKIDAVYNAEIKYETTLKEATIAKQQADIEIQKQRNTWLLISSIIALIIAGWVGLLYKKIKTKNGIIEKQKKDILHFQKNSNQQLYSMFNRQAENSEANNHLKTNKERVFAMNLVHGLLYEKQDTMLNVQQFLTILCNAKAIQDGLTVECIVPDTIILKADYLRDIGTIVNELITNAVKYAFTNETEKRVTVHVQKQNGEMYLHIQDNGKGLPDNFSLDKIGDSFGLSYVNDIVFQHDGTIKFSNNPGAHFDITLKL